MPSPSWSAACAAAGQSRPGVARQRAAGRLGLDVLRWMRQQPSLLSVPVVMLTAASGARAVREAYDSGAARCLAKPVGYDAPADVLRGSGRRGPWSEPDWALIYPWWRGYLLAGVAVSGVFVLLSSMSGSVTDGPTQRGPTRRPPDGPRAQRRLRGVNSNNTPIGAENLRS